MHDQFQLDIIEEWWKWHGQQWANSVYFTICCICCIIILLFRHPFYSFKLFIVDVICVVILIEIFIVYFICACLIFMWIDACEICVCVIARCKTQRPVKLCFVAPEK
jgi:hypothetical protein